MNDDGWTLRGGGFVALGLGLVLCAVSSCGESAEGTGGSGSTTDGSGGGPASSVSSSSSAASSTGSGVPLTCDSTPPYTTVPKGECDLLDQDCADGLSCEPKQSGGVWTTACLGNNGLKAVGKSCVNNVECQPGLFCIFGVCAPACCPASNEPCGGGTCNVEVAFGPHTLMVCSFLEQCTLLTENACEDPATGCHVQDAAQGLALCIPSSAIVPEGGACMYLNECGDMQHCQGGVCRYYCYVSAGGTGTPGLGGCPPGQGCFPGGFGIDDVGVCTPQ